MLTAATRNAALNELDVVSSVSLHSTYSNDGSAGELTGGVPAYARQSVVFEPALDGLKQMTFPLLFDVPAGSVVAWLGLWTAIPTCVGMIPIGGGMPQLFTVDVGTNVLTSNTHALTDGMGVVIWSGGYLLPLGLPQGSTFYVISATADTFQLSTVAGGIPTSVTSSGKGFVQWIEEQTFTTQSTFRLNSLLFQSPGI